MDENDTCVAEALARAKENNSAIEEHVRAALEVAKQDTIGKEKLALLQERRKMLRTMVYSPHPDGADGLDGATGRPERPRTAKQYAPEAVRPHAPHAQAPPPHAHAKGKTMQEQIISAVYSLPAAPTKPSLKKTTAYPVLPAQAATPGQVQGQSSEQQKESEAAHLRRLYGDGDDALSETGSDAISGASIRTSRPPHGKEQLWIRTFDGRFRRKHGFQIRVPPGYLRLREQTEPGTPSDWPTDSQPPSGQPSARRN